MTVYFGYEKKQVIQALRYHFITRPEIKILLIVINVFATGSAVLFAMHKIQPIAFLSFSLLWFILMLTIWTLLPRSIYKSTQTFKDEFHMTLDADEVLLKNEIGEQHWPWQRFSHLVESPFFFHLYFDQRSFFLLPKDAFNDADHIQEARMILKEKIKK